MSTDSKSFHIDNDVLSFDLFSFWKWAYSDLLANTARGILAEYIVKMALKDQSKSRVEWDNYDILTPKGSKIEVKSSAYIQRWKQKRLSTISFSIEPTANWDEKTGMYKQIKSRDTDYYIFCLLHHQDRLTMDPLNLSQWTFYVLSTDVLNHHKPHQKSISLSPLLKLNPQIMNFQQLCEIDI